VASFDFPKDTDVDFLQETLQRDLPWPGAVEIQSAETGHRKFGDELIQDSDQFIARNPFFDPGRVYTLVVQEQRFGASLRVACTSPGSAKPILFHLSPDADICLLRKILQLNLQWSNTAFLCAQGHYLAKKALLKDQKQLLARRLEGANDCPYCLSEMERCDDADADEDGCEISECTCGGRGLQWEVCTCH
jgi:hypothetical protein